MNDNDQEEDMAWERMKRERFGADVSMIVNEVYDRRERLHAEEEA